MGPQADRRRALEQIEHCALRGGLGCGLLGAELVRPGDERAEQQLVIGEDRDAHGEDRPAHGAEIPTLDRQRHIRADSGQVDMRRSNRDRLGGDDEEPAPRHRHHHVPDEARHGEGDLQAPEPLPGREPVAATRLFQIVRGGPERLVEAEGHVPGLAGEYCEDRRQLGAEFVVRKERHEEDDGEGQIAEHRHRLQDVEEGDEHPLRTPALRRRGCVGEGEEQRDGHGREHPQGRPQRVLGKNPRGQGHHRRLSRAQRSGHVASAHAEQEDHAQHHDHRGRFPQEARGTRVHPGAARGMIDTDHEAPSARA